MEASAPIPTDTTSLTLDDTATQEYEQEETPLESRTPLVDEGAAAAATPTTITTSINEDDTNQEYEQEEVPSETRTPLVDGGEVGVAVKLNEEDEDVHATMASTLPKYVIIQSNINHTYLRYNGENPDIPNAVHFDGDYSFGLETRFELVRATTGTGLVHIKSLRNNKFFAHSDTHNQWVTAMAVEREEDQSNQHCTLFRPFFVVSNNNRVGRLQHVNTGRFLRRFNGTSHAKGVLTLRPKLNPDDKTDEYTFIDWAFVVVLPDRIRIKGDNGNYLCAWGGEGFMDYNLQPENSGYWDFDVSPSRNGGIRLNSVFYNEWYWTDMDNSTWVLLKKPSTTVHNTNTVFLPVMRGGNRIVMRSLKSNMFCNRHTGGGKNNCLATRSTFPDNWSYMEIEEPVYSRTINNVKYHLADASIYIDGTPELKTDNTNNRTKSPLTAELDIRRTVTNTAKWSNSIGWKLGVKLTFQRGVPDVSSTGIEISAEVSKETEWEETEEEVLELGSVRTVTVPPESRVEMSLIATRVSYDIPFSYTQRDVLMNGTIKVYRKDDGLLTGKNGYDYKQDILQLPLPN